MSYARFSNADVYVYLDCGGYLCCCGCLIEGFFGAKTTADMLEHLEEHKKVGHDVPDFCIEGLKEDQKENDEWLENYDPVKELLLEDERLNLR